MTQSCEEGGGATLAPADEAARKRAAVETYAHHEQALRRTARRYSLCADDADDALQRGLEILLRKAPTSDPRELIRWTQTVVKHEALAVRRERERILSGPAAAPAREDAVDWISLIPTDADGPAERAERHEAVARSREALQELKPQELRALTLLAEGYSYREIGEITGYSQTKINRCLAEGRERFRKLLARNADGRRCAEMGPRLSAFCDGEASAEEQARMREHLRACGHCRATLRAYRAAPAAAAALVPALPLDRSLFERAHDAVTALAARFGGGGATDSALSQVAATGGSRGAGMAALAKALAICAGTVGGAACAATGVVPAPLAFESGGEQPRVERQAEQPDGGGGADAGAEYAPEAPAAETPPPVVEEEPEKKRDPDLEPAPAAVPETSGGAVEYTPPTAPVSPPPSAGAGAGAGSGSASGEFGP